MRFLSPGFLFALLTIAIPVIIHLFNFRKFKKVYFSNVRFLKDVQLQISSRQHLKDRLILFTRILGLSFLAFAFAQPYIPAEDQRNGFQQEVLSIYIDNSYSMEAVNKEGTLLDEAKRKARELSSAHGISDKFQLLTNDFEGKNQRLLSFEEFQKAVDEVKISSANRTIDQIISRQREVFLKEPNSLKTIYFISDFQKSIIPKDPIPVDSSIKIRLVKLSSNSLPNVSIDSVWFGTAIHKPGDSEKLVVRLRNNSDVQPSLSLLIINGAKQSDYLNSVYRSDPFFMVVNVAAGNINYSGLSEYPLIILNEVASMSDGLIQQLNSYILRGGSLIVFPDLENDQSDLKKFLTKVGTDIPIQVLNTENKVTAINLDHPVFQGVFENVPKQIDLPVVKKYLRYSSQNTNNRQNLLEMQGKISFFSEYKIGSGKIYLSAATLNSETSNFARHSVFVPIMYQTALLSLRNQNLFFKLNRDQQIELPKISLNSNQTLKLKNEKFEAIPDLRQNENFSQLYIADQIKKPENYQLLKNDSLIAVLSFNENGSESNMSYLNNGQIKELFPKQKIEILNTDPSSISNAVKSIDQGTSLWKVCLILALFFFAAEILLLRFYKGTQIKPINN